jgi:hypothetical protein
MYATIRGTPCILDNILYLDSKKTRCTLGFLLDTEMRD